MSAEKIQVTTAKDFLNYICKQLTKDKEFKKAILSKYRFIFAQNISAILNNPDQSDWKTNYFELVDSKLYFNIRHKEVYDLHSEMMIPSEVVEHIGHPLFNLLIADLKSIIFKEGYNYIEYVLKKILTGMGIAVKDILKDENIDAYVLAIGDIHGESINNLITKIARYGKILEGLNGFSLKEWDGERTIIDANVLHKICLNSDNFKDFIFKYFEGFVVLMLRSVFELEAMIEKAKIKYN